MFFGVEIKRENPAAALVGIENEFEMAGIQRDFAVRIAEAVRFAVVVVAVIADAAAGAVDIGEIRIVTIAAERVGRPERERAILPGAVSDKVQGAARLRSIEQG